MDGNVGCRLRLTEPGAPTTGVQTFSVSFPCGPRPHCHIAGQLRMEAVLAGVVLLKQGSPF